MKRYTVVLLVCLQALVLPYCHKRRSLTQLMQENVSENRLTALLNHICGIRNGAAAGGHIQYTRRLIDSLFHTFGMQVIAQPFAINDCRGRNLIGIMKGTKSNAGILIAMAHFDTVKDSPGADDNASGLAALLELARICSGARFEHTLVFLALDGEEYGMAGSNALLSDRGILPSGPFDGVINLDMIGFYSDKPFTQHFPRELEAVFPAGYRWVSSRQFRGDFIISIANSPSADLDSALRLTAKATPQCPEVLSLRLNGNSEAFPEFRRSDHAVFWDHGYKALYIGDGSFTRNPNYHSPGDSLNTINVHRIAQITKLLVGLFCRLEHPGEKQNDR